MRVKVKKNSYLQNLPKPKIKGAALSHVEFIL